MTPLSGKKTWSSELSASIKTCSRWQRMGSSSGISCLRLEDGKASKSRFRGQFDGALIREPPRLDIILGSNLTAFLGACLARLAAGLAFGDFGPLLAFLLAIRADHLDHLWQNVPHALN